MIVSELIEILKKFPQDNLVITAVDAEGNGYSPLAGSEEVNYWQHSQWSGEVIHPDDVLDYEDNLNLVKAVCLYPT